MDDSNHCVLTIAVPTFNMEWCLEKNLMTYCDERLFGRLEVICLNNASRDASRKIIQHYVERYPRIFCLRDWNGKEYISSTDGSPPLSATNSRDWIGYGSAINDAISIASGTYFRLVDADDWVDTSELVRLVDQLECCEADVVLTDYQVVNMQDGSAVSVRCVDGGATYGEFSTDLSTATRLLPSTHATTFRTALLRESGFRVQEGMFFVDEEYVILPYLHVKSIICYPFNVYRYQVADPRQSTSPQNRAKYCRQRERILRRLIREYYAAKRQGASSDALNYCFHRIQRGVGDHCTTLYMYVEDRSEGRRLAREWTNYIRREAPEFWVPVRRKAAALALLNRFHVSLAQYEALKRILQRTTKRPSQKSVIAQHKLSEKAKE